MFLVLGAMSFAAAPATACSMASGYKVPTNLELAIKGETIIIGEVIGERTGSNEWNHAVLVRPLTLLKGETLPDQVEIAGAAVAPPQVPVTLSAPGELRAPNPDAMSGYCVRYHFTKGGKLLLFLARDEQSQLVPFRSAFSRDSEDVADEDALWVKAVREYAAISLLPPEDQRRAIKSRIAALQAAGDSDSLAIARDLTIELSGKRRPPFD
ncbi:MAG: hypothetical protein EOP58_02115 [Sphingomonadales bacterium]|nr:MAG: hypothetical protein EOP58_02115 [Sphingomonadales bacterium]